jgi:hypothetical protein
MPPLVQSAVAQLAERAPKAAPPVETPALHLGLSPSL